MTTIQVSFEDYEDLSRRLVLMPRIEDEGRGAVVASFEKSDHHKEMLLPGKNETTNASLSFVSSVSSDSSECRDEKDDPTNNNNNNNNIKCSNSSNSSLVGCVLVGSLKDADFATILSFLRGQPGPIVLDLMEPASSTTDGDNLRLDKSSSCSTQGGSAVQQEGRPNDDASSTASDSELEEEDDDDEDEAMPRETNNNNNNNNNNTQTNNAAGLAGRWQVWGSRMRVAAEAASTVAVQSLQAAAVSRGIGSTTNATTTCTQQLETPPCSIHVQTSLGAFLPLLPTGSNTPRSSSSELHVTISSVLYIRCSAVEACPPRGYQYQWYKGLPNITKDRPLDQGWIPIKGADCAAFQLSTTEIGYKLLCHVTVDKCRDSSIMDSDSDSDHDSDDDDDHDHDDASENGRGDKPMEIRCITPYVVAADMSLFNGARQALVRGAHFGGMIGKGRAQGRKFRVQLGMGYQERKFHNRVKKRISSTVKVEQVSGDSAEPLHSEPLYNVTARSCHTHSKALDMVFRMTDLTDDASLMSALVSEEGILQLEAPNRFARESLLLALGIANFKGKSSELDATTILYPPNYLDDNDDNSVYSYDSSCGSTRSDATSQAWSADQTPKVLRNQVPTPTPEHVSSRQRSRSESIESQCSAGDLSTIETEAAEEPSSLRTLSTQPESGPSEREVELEQEVAFLRAKLAKKDKVVSELQRQVTRTDAALHEANQQNSQSQQTVRTLESQLQLSEKAQKRAEQMAEEHLTNMKKLKEDHASQISKLKKQLENQENTIADLEKTVKSHQNEKAVLSAAVEARESKLSKMADLQESFVALSSKVSEQDQWRKELEEKSHRYHELKADLQKLTEAEKECRQELETTTATLQRVQKELVAAKDHASSCKSELNGFQAQNQKLKSERNSYKQKAESLSREIARICRNGRSLADVERILANEEVRQEEVFLLRQQKRKALEECHSYRKSYEQSRAAQEIMLQAASNPTNKASSKKTDVNQSAVLLLERNVELERLVTELTEYVNAKEMQLETMKEVNAALQHEIHGLARASMDRNDI